MAREFDGSAGAYSLPDISGIGDFTVACYIRPVTNTNDDSTYWWENFPSTPRNCVGFTPQANVGGTPRQWECYVGGTGGTAVGASALSTGTDYWVALTRSGTTAKGYVDGTQIGSDITVGSGTFTGSNVRIGCHYFSGTNNQFINARLGEWAIWTAVLDAAELAALADGVSPLLVRPTSLIRYVPLVRGEVELKTGATVTAIGSPSVAAHPRVFMPRGRRVFLPPSTITHTYTGSGGITLGGTAPLARTRVATGSGGLTLGGTAPLARTRVAPAPSGGLTLGGSAPLARVRVATGAGGITLGGAAPSELVGPEINSYTGTGGLTLGGSAATSAELVAPPGAGADWDAYAGVPLAPPRPKARAYQYRGGATFAPTLAGQARTAFVPARPKGRPAVPVPPPAALPPLLAWTYQGSGAFSLPLSGTAPAALDTSVHERRKLRQAVEDWALGVGLL